MPLQSSDDGGFGYVDPDARTRPRHMGKRRGYNGGDDNFYGQDLNDQLALMREQITNLGYEFANCRTEVRSLRMNEGKVRKDLEAGSSAILEQDTKFKGSIKALAEETDGTYRGLQTEITERCKIQERILHDLALANERINKVEIHGKERLQVENALQDVLKNLFEKVDKEEQARMAGAQRLLKTVDAAVEPIQVTIQEDLARFKSTMSVLQEEMQAIQAEKEFDSGERNKVLDTLNRIATQTRKDVDKEVQERRSRDEHMTAMCREMQQNLERLNKDRDLAEEASRKGIQQEERARTGQISGLADCFSTMQHDMEEEMRVLKQSMDARFRERRQVDDETARRLTEFSVMLEQEGSKRDALEGVLRTQIASWRQDHLNEKEDVNGVLHRSMQNVEALLNQQLSDVKACLENETSKRVRACEWLEKCISDVSKEAKERATSHDDEVMRIAMQARHIGENEAKARRASDDQTRQILMGLTERVQTEQLEKRLEAIELTIKTLLDAQFEDKKKEANLKSQLRELQFQKGQASEHDAKGHQVRELERQITELRNNHKSHLETVTELSRGLQLVEAGAIEIVRRQEEDRMLSNGKFEEAIEMERGRISVAHEGVQELREEVRKQGFDFTNKLRQETEEIRQWILTYVRSIEEQCSELQEKHSVHVLQTTEFHSTMGEFKAQSKELQARTTGMCAKYEGEMATQRVGLDELAGKVKCISERLSKGVWECQEGLKAQKQYVSDVENTGGLEIEEQFRAHVKHIQNALASETLERQQQFEMHMKSVNDAVTAEALERQKQFQICTELVTNAVSMEASKRHEELEVHSEQLKVHNEQHLLGLEDCKNEVLCLIRKENEGRSKHFNDFSQVLDTHHQRFEMSEKVNEQRFQQYKFEHDAMLASSAERLNELAHTVEQLCSAEKVERRSAFEEQTETIKQMEQRLENDRLQDQAKEIVAETPSPKTGTVKEPLMALIEKETLERCRSATALASGVEKLSAEVNNLRLQLSGELRECKEGQLSVVEDVATMRSLVDQSQQQVQSLRLTINDVQDNFAEKMSVQNNELLLTINNLSAALRKDLDHEIHFRESCIKGVREEVELHRLDVHNALLQEATDREGEDHNMQLSVSELREKTNNFKLEIDDVTRRVWDAIEMHTHDIQIDDAGEADSNSNFIQLSSEQHSLHQISPPRLHVASARVVGSSTPNAHLGVAVKANSALVANVQPLMPSVLAQPQLATRVSSPSVANLSASLKNATPNPLNERPTSLPSRGFSSIRSPPVSLPAKVTR